MQVFEPPTAYPTRGLPRIIGGGLLTLLRCLPALVGLSLVLVIVAALAGLAVIVPALVGASIDPWLGYAAAVLMLVPALPFLVLWDAAGSAAILALLGSRPLGHRLGPRAALGLGVRRALPLLGTSLASALLIGLVALPMSFVGLAAWFLWGLGSSGEAGGAILTGLALLLALLLPFLVWLFLLVFTRLVMARFVAVFEDRGPLASLERAWELSAGQAPRIAFYALLGLLAFAALGLVASPAASQLGLPVPDYAAATTVLESPEAWRPADQGQWILLGRALATVGLPALASTGLGLWVLASALLLYFDIRRRKERFGHGGGLEPDFRLDLDPEAPVPAELPEAEDPNLLSEVDAAPRPAETRLPEAWTVEGEALESEDGARGLDAEPRPGAGDPLPDRLSVEPEVDERSELPPASSPASAEPRAEDATAPPASPPEAAPGDAPAAASPSEDAPPTSAEEGMGDGGKRLGRDAEVDPSMRRLIDMLPEPEPVPESRPRFVDRLLGWLPAPESDRPAPSEGGASDGEDDGAEAPRR